MSGVTYQNEIDRNIKFSNSSPVCMCVKGLCAFETREVGMHGSNDCAHSCLNDSSGSEQKPTLAGD